MNPNLNVFKQTAAIRLSMRLERNEGCLRILQFIPGDEDGAVGLIGVDGEVWAVGAVAVGAWDTSVLAHWAGLLVVVGFEAFFHQAFGELKPILQKGKENKTIINLLVSGGWWNFHWGVDYNYKLDIYQIFKTFHTHVRIRDSSVRSLCKHRK